MSRTALLALVTVLSLFIPSTTRSIALGENVELSGYVKSYVVGFDEPVVKSSSGDEGGGFRWAVNNRVRANLGAAITDWLRLDIAYDLSLRIQGKDLALSPLNVVFTALSIYRAADLELLLWPDDITDQVTIYQNLDRLYLTVSAKRFDVYVGRQAIAWGSAKAINPTDIIAPFLYTDIDTEDRLGVDALRIRIPTGLLGELDAGYIAGDDFEWSRSAAFLRGRFYTRGTDFSLLAMVFRENVLAGIDVTRAVSSAGVWGEAAYVWADAANSRVPSDKDMDYIRLSAGVDYNFNIGGGLYSFLEYHYNGAGASQPHDYLSNVSANSTAYVDGAVYLLGRQYVIPGVSYQLTPLTLVFVQTIVNLDDGSFVLSPQIEYNATENIYLSLGSYTAVGSNPAVEPAGPSSTLILESEFGSYASRYYAFARYYF